MTLPFDQIKTTYTGSYRGGLAAPKESVRTKLIRKAVANGWALVPSAGDDLRFEHPDGAILHVSVVNHRIGLGAFCRNDATGDVALAQDDVDKVLEGARCDCSNTLPAPYDYARCPDPTCDLTHPRDYALIYEVTIQPASCYEGHRCGYCFHCTMRALACGPCEKEVVNA